MDLNSMGRSSSSSSSEAASWKHPRHHEREELVWMMERIERMASENAVLIFSMSTCCMSHAVKTLFSGLGVNPMVCEIDHHPYAHHLERALTRLLGASAVPVVFIGGKLVGAVDRVIASHITGHLVPLLKDAGALWL